MSLLACAPGAVGPSFRGAPLFTVSGQLITRAAPPTTPIRLAVAWYPSEDGPSAPRAIVTQDVEYTGSFPLNYAFSFFTVPPEGVLTDYRDGAEVTRAAFGVLLAYEDVNGNGRLDSIAQGGSPIDHVLGTSVGDTYSGAALAAPVWVAFIDGQPGARWTDARPGYNLWRSRAVVPEASPVPIELTMTNELNFFVCEEFISGSSYGYDLPCNIAPTGGVRVIGNVTLENGAPFVSLQVSDGARVLPSLRVELNGVVVPFAADFGLYRSGSVQVLAPGRNVVKVTPPVGAPLEFNVEAPADFTLHSPDATTRTLRSGSVSAAWSPAAGAQFFQVNAYEVTPPYEGLPPTLVNNLGETRFARTLSGFGRVGVHQVVVSAFAPGYLAHGRGGSLVNVSTARAEYFEVLADDIGGWLAGSVALGQYRGQPIGSVQVQAFDGITAVSNALVTIDGEPVSYDPRRQYYLASTTAQPGSTVTLGVTPSGGARKTFTVSLPGDFTLTAPPARHPPNTPLTLTWTRAADATDYRVYVTDPSGRQRFFEYAFDTTLTLPGFDAQDLVITVAATRLDASGHLLGSIEYSADVTIVP